MNMTGRHCPMWANIISTSFGCGYWPWGPGTMGAIGGVALWLVCLVLMPSVPALWAADAVLIVIFTILGVASGTVAEKYWGPDPSRVVMDETVGQWIAMLPLSCFAGLPAVWSSWQMWTGVAVSLALFRFFDIVKPLGVRSMERFPGGWGIMADDILAGIYAGIITLLYTLAV